MGQDSFVGEKTTIGEKVPVKKSVIGKNCSIGEKSKIAQSVIMDDVVIGEGSVKNYSRFNSVPRSRRFYKKFHLKFL